MMVILKININGVMPKVSDEAHNLISGAFTLARPHFERAIVELAHAGSPTDIKRRSPKGTL